MRPSLNNKHEAGSARSRLFLLVVAALLLAATSPAWAGKGNANNPGVMPPQANPQGQSYAEWLSEWWTGYWPMPYEYYDAHPLGQSGHVGHLFSGTSGTIDLTVPAGTMLFLSPYSCATGDFPQVWDMPYNDPVTGMEYASEADFAKAFNGRVVDGVSVRCWIDGREVRNLQAYRLQAPFGGVYPEGNWLDAPPDSQYVGLAEGKFLMLAPLPVGTHTIQVWTMMPEEFLPYFGFAGEWTTVFHITVQGRSRK
jgi:hypothetical protein